MSYLALSTSSIQTTGIICQGAKLDESQRQRYVSFSCVDYLVSKHGPLPVGNSPHAASIHVLDDDSLLNIFHLYRLEIFDVDEDDAQRILGWERERWWYKLAQVCQRWRIILLGSASYLGLCLVCTYGTPVEDMLAHSPPFPLVIDYFGDITAEDEDGIILALKKRDRVRRVRLETPVLQLRNLMVAIDEEYPVLEYLIILPSTVDRSGTLMLPETLQVPHLRYLALKGVALPMGSRFLTTAVRLVTFCLSMDYPSAYYFVPSTLLQWISFMPQLETLMIIAYPNFVVVRQLMPTLIVTHVTLPNLRLLEFRGYSSYLEWFVCRITTPCLQKLVIRFPRTSSFIVPRLLHFMNASENLRFNSAKFFFSSSSHRVYVKVYPAETEMYSFSIHSLCEYLREQACMMARVFDSPGQTFSTVEHLALKCEKHSRSFEEVDRTEWHKLLRSFSNVKTLHVDYGLVEELSRCLRLDDGEHPLALLPELQKLTYSGSGNTGDAFTSFIDTRQNANRPVTLVRSSPRLVTPLSRSSTPDFPLLT